MAINRYRYTRIITNNTSEYSDIMRRRGVNFINHFSFKKFKHLQSGDVPGLTYLQHIWTSSDRFYKLADKYYGDPLYWWLIAKFNNTPLETDITIGDTLYIPQPLERLLLAMDI